MPEKLILWIENELDYAGAHLKALRRAGYVVHTAWSAEEGMQTLRQRPKYDLILLDILMGEQPVEGREVMNGRTGLAVYEGIRDDLKLSVPIVFITVIVDPAIVADVQQREAARGFEPSFLHKPVRPSDLLQTVRSVIGRAQPMEGENE